MATGSNNSTFLIDSNAKILVNPDFDSTETEGNAVPGLIKELLQPPKKAILSKF